MTNLFSNLRHVGFLHSIALTAVISLGFLPTMAHANDDDDDRFEPDFEVPGFYCEKATAASDAPVVCRNRSNSRDVRVYRNAPSDSSITVVDPPLLLPPIPIPGLTNPVINQGSGTITLFSDFNFQGSTISLSNGSSDLRSQGFNDEMSSLIVRSGNWTLCQGTQYSGICRTFGPGAYANVTRFGFSNDSLSSLRPQ